MDWEKAGPSAAALEAFASVESEDEFPNTYSGQSWRAAFRIWRAYRDKPEALDSIGPYDDIPGADLYGMGLSGFMVGWAMNAVRQMLGRQPGANGAVIVLGEKNQPAVPAMGPAEADLKRAIGGSETKPEGTE
jgi:hypothetical protein